MDPLEIRRIKLLDGMHYSFRLLEHHYMSMYHSCADIPKANDSVVAALASCWGFIDVLHRLRELAQSVPGLGGKKPELRRFLSASALAEQYRHHIQHLRRELGKPSPSPFPVWGSLSWVDPQDQQVTHTVMIGARLPSTEYSGAVFDTHKQRWVSRVCLSVGKSVFNFDPIFEEAKVFEKFVMPWMLARTAVTLNESGDLPIVSARIMFKNA